MSGVLQANADISSTVVAHDRHDEAVAGRASAIYGRLAWLVVGMGILARVVRYALGAPLWGDEHFQAAAFLDHDYLDLLGILPYEQVAPFGFLWIELTFVKLLGFHEWSLRLFPLLAGIGSVLLFHRVSRRLLGPLPSLLAVAAFSATYALIRYSCEVKPYSSDAFESLGLIALFVEWRRDPARVRWLWALALATPLALCMSFPAVFVAGGISVGLLGLVWQARSRSAWTAYVVFNLLLGATFLALQHWVLSRQYDSSTSFMLPFWIDGFMPIADPWRIPWWLVEMHTGDMFAYPFGGPNFQSVLTTLCCGVGLWCCRDRRRRSLAWAVLGMLGLALVASAMRRYPYGIHPRVVLYAAPAICLLFGAGAAFLIERVPAAKIRQGLPWFFAAAMVIVLSALMVRDVIRPYRALRDLEHRNFARSLWASEPETDLVCVRREWQRPLYRNNADSAYVCSAGIFGNARADATPGKLRRCVVFHSEGAVLDQAEFGAWMRAMTQRYDLVGTEQYKTSASGEGAVDTYDVYRFLPR